MSRRSAARLALFAGLVALTFPQHSAANAVGQAVSPGRSVSITVSGDLIAHNTLYTRARTKTGYDFRPLLAGVKPLLAGDVNICQLETPLTSGTPSNYPRFATPVQLADAIKSVGFNGCSFASNHSIDRGVVGVTDTLRALRQRGLVTAGSRIRATESGMGWYRTANGLRIAQLSYTYGLNGLWLPSDKTWVVNQISVKSILADAHSARLRGADLVIVTLHWGVEYGDEPTAGQRRTARLLSASPDVDAVVGHHAHVLQTAALVNGKPVLFGLGNLWSGQVPRKGMPRGQHGAIATLNFTVDEQGRRFTGGSYVPTLTLDYSWLLQPAIDVKQPGQRAEACRSIEDAATHLGTILTGPASCPPSS